MRKLLLTIACLGLMVSLSYAGGEWDTARLDRLRDVSVDQVTLSDGDILIYDGVFDYWKNVTHTAQGEHIARVDTVASSATPAINVDTTDLFTITALAENITSMTTGLSGSGVNGQKLIIRIKDNGTAYTIAWGASYKSIAPLPTVTIISKTLYVG